MLLWLSRIPLNPQACKLRADDVFKSIENLVANYRRVPKDQQREAALEILTLGADLALRLGVPPDAIGKLLSGSHYYKRIGGFDPTAVYFSYFSPLAKSQKHGHVTL
ncbi:MAG TPA: hypothetical protein VH595_20365 [Verrucomicrobiae bacterium]|jgi:hypothetical protein|nr:hypothetical protein [Verrucomicrobiae bacterium]